ncbi:DUF960 family protein [Bacillus sp. B1-b2]|uniref:DUF960 family protein n=1 Tax=Bacillus sp. B1-b2 TaxID=2653201 RepID=UPI0012625D54|nr:DUF960 family protein [Bacillus sp. B1-b2]KAB7666035.1 DUF960 domain-containing protein [Bacillus sp. B1-b2]
MFETHKPRYMTRAVTEQLSTEHQQFIIQYLLKQQNQLTDYLQVFEFYVENNQQFLRQEQEVPHREVIIFVRLEKCRPIKRTVWAMNQGLEGIIIMFLEDY